MSTYDHRATVTEPIDEAQWNAMTGQERRWYVRDRVDLFVSEDPYAMSFEEGMRLLAHWQERDRELRRECVAQWRRDLRDRVKELLP